MPEHFALSEFIASDTADRFNLRNIPEWADVAHLRELVETILDPLRTAWGGPINVTSGYRSTLLNAIVGGVNTSAHLYGYAADIVPAKGTVKAFSAFVKEWAQRSGVKFDQIIDESQGGKRWVHIAVRDRLGRQRGQILNISK
ncbi:MAG: peptidase M15 [Clostridia bacterium]|nr:peptidase M15 [Clostridia bacterium]